MTMTGGVIHLVTPGSGHCQTGREVVCVRQLTKQPRCPNPAMRGSEFCSQCRKKALERVMAGRER